VINKKYFDFEWVTWILFVPCILWSYYNFIPIMSIFDIITYIIQFPVCYYLIRFVLTKREALLGPISGISTLPKEFITMITFNLRLYLSWTIDYLILTLVVFFDPAMEATHSYFLFCYIVNFVIYLIYTLHFIVGHMEIWISLQGIHVEVLKLELPESSKSEEFLQETEEFLKKYLYWREEYRNYVNNIAPFMVANLVWMMLTLSVIAVSVITDTPRRLASVGTSAPILYTIVYHVYIFLKMESETNEMWLKVLNRAGKIDLDTFNKVWITYSALQSKLPFVPEFFGISLPRNVLVSIGISMLASIGGFLLQQINDICNVLIDRTFTG